jgi:hypothetical protein
VCKYHRKDDVDAIEIVTMVNDRCRRGDDLEGTFHQRSNDMVRYIIWIDDAMVEKFRRSGDT